MTAGTSTEIDGLIGVYDADGGLLGELRYAWARTARGRHCTLCDITHGTVRMKPEWRAVRDRLGVSIELMHRDERPSQVRDATGDDLPCVLARVGDGVQVLLSPSELEACRGSVIEFEQRLRRAISDRGLLLRAQAG